MALNSPAGLIAVILAVISFLGTTYAVLALNVGWRFGYWLASAAFGALMVLLSIFWVVTALGPRGEEPRWIPLAADRASISGVQLDDQTLQSPGAYPGGDWQEPPEEGGLAAQQEAFESAAGNCLTADPEGLPEEEQSPCEAAQALMPPDENIPIIEGVEVALTPELTDIRFSEEGGRLLGQTTVVPLTRDPRVADDPEVGQALGDELLLLAVLDTGSVRTPAYGSLIVSLIYFAIHMFGLHRAERRKLSPILAGDGS